MRRLPMCMLAGALLWIAAIAHAADADQAVREAFAAAAAAPDSEARLASLAAQRPTLGYQVALDACERAVLRRSRGEDAEPDFAIAERIARALAARPEGQVIEIFVSVYRTLDRAAALERMRARGAVILAEELANAGKLDDALHNAAEALRIGEALEDPWIMADAERVGGVALKNVGDLERARRSLESALARYRQMRNVLGQGRTLGNLGQVRRRLGDFEGALDASAKSRELAKLAGDPATLAGEWASAGLVYNRLGQYRPALEHLSNAMRLYPEGPGAWRDRAIVFQNLGLVYENLGLLREAKAHFESGLNLLGDDGTWAVDRAVLHASLANIHSQLGEAALATKLYTSALDAFVSNRQWPHAALIEGNLGKLALERGDTKEAMTRYGNAERLAPGDAQIRALALLGRTEAALRESDPKQALEWAGQACAAGGQGAPVRAACHRAQGYAQRLLGDPNSAALSYRLAIDALEEVRAAIGDPTETPAEALFGGVRVYYQEAIDLELELDQVEPTRGHHRAAFLLAEQAKSSIFQDQVRRAGMRFGPDRDADFRALQTAERGALVRLLAAARVAQQAAPEERPAAESRREQAARGLTDARARMFDKYPVQREVEQPGTLSIERIQAALAPGEALVSYSLGPRRSAAFVLRRDTFATVHLDIAEAEMIARVSALRRDLEPPPGRMSSGALAAALRRSDPAASADLYRRVFAPVESMLADSNRVFVAADGALYLLPFAALVGPKFDAARFEAARARADGRDEPLLAEYRDVPYLGYQRAFRYLPAASVLAYLRTVGAVPAASKWDTPLVAFADPDFGDAADRRLARVPATGRQATDVATLLHAPEANVYLGTRATKASLRSAPLKGARYLLFSTHGLLGGDYGGGGEPALALARAGSTPGDDGLLTMSEVIGLDLSAELTVLSACSTAGDPARAERHGEGFAGLARSFMYAGSRAVLVTHWSVFETVARDFVVEFFKHAPDDGADAALARAVEVMHGGSADAAPERVSLAHPAFWAGFALLGD